MWKPVRYADAAAHAPRPLPVRIVLTWSDDPASTQSVTWRTVYVVSVSGPKMYDITNESFVRTAEDTQLYQIVDVNGDELHFEARTATGRLYDAFTLKKRDGRPNELREMFPPQNRRSKG